MDIRDAILSLVSVLRDQMDKLERHEVRERQLGEQLTRSLASLEKRTRGEEKNIENIGGYIARIDEKIKFAQATLDKVQLTMVLRTHKYVQGIGLVLYTLSGNTL